MTYNSTTVDIEFIGYCYNSIETKLVRLLRKSLKVKISTCLEDLKFVLMCPNSVSSRRSAVESTLILNLFVTIVLHAKTMDLLQRGQKSAKNR